eukprot:2776151-Amphidinium_carterae.1
MHRRPRVRNRTTNISAKGIQRSSTTAAKMNLQNPDARLVLLIAWQTTGQDERLHGHVARSCADVHFAD